VAPIRELYYDNLAEGQVSQAGHAAPEAFQELTHRQVFIIRLIGPKSGIRLTRYAMRFVHANEKRRTHTKGTGAFYGHLVKGAVWSCRIKSSLDTLFTLSSFPAVSL
jgi:hypothetical protein